MHFLSSKLSFVLKNNKFNKLGFGRMFLSTLFKWRRERSKHVPDISVPPVTSANCVPHCSFQLSSPLVQDSKGIHKLWCWLKVVLQKLLTDLGWPWVNNCHELSKCASPATVTAGFGSGTIGQLSPCWWWVPSPQLVPVKVKLSW